MGHITIPVEEYVENKRVLATSMSTRNKVSRKRGKKSITQGYRVSNTNFN